MPQAWAMAAWAYCLMPNHVHLILVPDRGRALGERRRRYSSTINARLGVTGHRLQVRFGWVAMDEEHLMAAGRTVAWNPVRARLVERADDWRWSSAQAHLAGRDDGLASVAPLLDSCRPFADSSRRRRQPSRCRRCGRPSPRIDAMLAGT